LAYVLARQYSHVLLLDADLQHDPAEIPKLIEQAERGIGDFVLGEREFTKGAMPTARFYSNVIGSRILSTFIGATVADTQSGFRLIRADLAYFNADPSRLLLSRLSNDVWLLRGAAANGLSGIGKDAVTVVFLVGVMFSQAPVTKSRLKCSSS
jgi:hypothetical protein